MKTGRRTDEPYTLGIAITNKFVRNSQYARQTHFFSYHVFKGHCEYYQTEIEYMSTINLKFIKLFRFDFSQLKSCKPNSNFHSILFRIKTTVL